jgi:tetratricopeptide (TPR) repeat protein
MQHRQIVAFALAFSSVPAGAARAASSSDATAASAQSSNDVVLAERYAAEAFLAYQRKAYAEALALYEKALAAAPSADILYNMARIYDTGLRERRAAMDYYARCAADPSAGESRIQAANQRRMELERAEQAMSVDSPESDGLERTFPRDPIEVPTPPPAPATERPSSWTGLEITGLTLGSVGLVGLGVGVGFGLAARAEKDTWSRDCNGNVCASQRGVDAAASAREKAQIATVGLGVGGGLLLLGSVLFLIDSDGGDEQGDGHEGLATWRSGPVATDAELGWVVAGSW